MLSLGHSRPSPSYRVLFHTVVVKKVAGFGFERSDHLFSSLIRIKLSLLVRVEALFTELFGQMLDPSLGGWIKMKRKNSACFVRRHTIGLKQARRPHSIPAHRAVYETT